MADLPSKLEELRRSHAECEDCWYSCPKSEGGCCNDHVGEDCTCGADYHNTILDEIISFIIKEKL